MSCARAAILFLSGSTIGFGETWSGPLVDSKCYAAEERNVNPTDTQTFVDRDRNYEIRYCSPNHKTKFFAIVGLYGERLKFDDGGNAKAAGLVRNINKKHLLRVSVSGEMAGNTIKVDSIFELSQR